MNRDERKDKITEWFRTKYKFNHNFVYNEAHGDLADQILSLIEGERCVWEIVSDDPGREDMIKMGCNNEPKNIHFLLRRDVFPFCPCCGKRIEMKNEQG
jgi:hypothetical protein